MNCEKCGGEITYSHLVTIDYTPVEVCDACYDNIADDEAVRDEAADNKRKDRIEDPGEIT